jgi:shikimate kinase
MLGCSLNRQVVSLDEEIVHAAGRSIPQIVEEQGWDGFRNLEEAICCRESLRKDLIIDCGGGVVERQANCAVLRENGIVFWLKAQPTTIVGRIGKDTQRPSLTGTKSFTEEVAEVLERRTPLYRQIAHYEIDTDELPVPQIVTHILDRFPGCQK